MTHHISLEIEELGEDEPNHVWKIVKAPKLLNVTGLVGTKDYLKSKIRSMDYELHYRTPDVKEEKKFVDTILAENCDLKRQLFDGINSSMRLLPLNPSHNPFADFDRKRDAAPEPSQEDYDAADHLLHETAVEMLTEEGHPDPKAAAKDLLNQPCLIEFPSIDEIDAAPQPIQRREFTSYDRGATWTSDHKIYTSWENRITRRARNRQNDR